MALIGLFGRDRDRGRTWFERVGTSIREGTFHGHAQSGGKRFAILGTGVAREGVVFVAPGALSEREFDISFTLRARTIPARVRSDRDEPMQHKGKIVHRYACTFTAIAADDWDAVVRYVDDTPEPNIPVTQKPALDDDFRTLPQLVQQRIVAILVREKRLAPPAAGVAPLIRLRAGLVRDLGAGRSSRDVKIHSRVVRPEATRSFDTTLRVFSDDRVELLP